MITLHQTDETIFIRSMSVKTCQHISQGQIMAGYLNLNNCQALVQDQVQAPVPADPK